MRRVTRWSLGVVCALVLSLAAVPAAAKTLDPAAAGGGRFLLRLPPEELAKVASRYDLDVLDLLVDGAEGEVVALVASPLSLTAAQAANAVTADPVVVGFEPEGRVALPEATLEQSSAAILEQSSAAILEAAGERGVYGNGVVEGFFRGALWSGYATQPAAGLIRLREAHAQGAPGRAYGEGVVVAVIDNGVDPRHPMLAGALVPGYDFLTDEPGIPSEWSNLDQSSAAILEQSSAAILEIAIGTLLDGDGEVHLLEQSSAAILEQSSAAILEGHDLPPTFGHGTMVAGLVRLVAPGARIMPLKAFGADGTANTFDIVRAIRWAVAHGAQVINMSFSTEDYSPELARAVNAARARGVVTVAAAGNRGERAITYPAALGSSLGVAATDLKDALSVFSNQGSDVAALSAPGEALISTYPGGSFAAVWGTSFAAPLVAGTVALLAGVVGDGADPDDAFEAASALARGARFVPELASEIAAGRLDAAAAVRLAGPAPR